jgi:hypothetical protein
MKIITSCIRYYFKTLNYKMTPMDMRFMAIIDKKSVFFFFN